MITFSLRSNNQSARTAANCYNNEACYNGSGKEATIEMTCDNGTYSSGDASNIKSEEHEQATT